MRTAERGEEVVESVLVGHVDDGELCTPFVLVTAKQVVVSKRHMEQIAGGNAWRIMVVILRTDRRNLDKTGAELRRQARGRQSRSGGCANAIAGKPGLELLIGT